MKNLLSKYWVLVLLIASITSCKPDEPVGPQNPLNGKSTAVFNPTKSYGKVTDVDGNVYKTIKIGNQVWMAENLRVTRYRNGEVIPNVKDSEEWARQTEGAYCNYNNTENLDTIATYGRLYNWYITQDSRNVAPEGWRVSTGEDWLELIDYLGGEYIASKHLKEEGYLHWFDMALEDGIADNSSGFTALPSGWRHKNDTIKMFDGFSIYADFWTSSEALGSETHAPFLYLAPSNRVWKGYNFKENGYAIRCVKE